MFLDAYDVDHGKHSALRQSRYERFLGGRIDEQQCHPMHLECAQSLVEKLAPRGVICFDDIWLAEAKWTAKGTLGMPYLLRTASSCWRRATVAPCCAGRRRGDSGGRGSGCCAPVVRARAA